MHRIKTALSASLLVITLLASIVLTPETTTAITQPQAAAAYNMYTGPNNTARVILTYDDCPRSLAAYRAMLHHARSRNIGLVLAPTGDCVLKYYRQYGVDIAQLARQYSQYVINHTKTHPKLTTLTYNQIISELSGQVYADIGRPPYGAYKTPDDRVRKAYAARGMRMWLWNVDSRDWEGKTRAQVVSYVIRNSQRGQTTLLHMQWNGFSQIALTDIQMGLAKRKLYLCRAYRGFDNAGGYLETPRLMRGNYLPC